MIVEKRAGHRADAVLRAGWIFTAVTAVMGLILAGVIYVNPASGIWTTSAVRAILEIAVWTYVPPLLLLSAFAIWRGAPRRGLLLLIGSPLLLHSLDLMLAGSVSGWATESRQEGQAAGVAPEDAEHPRSSGSPAPFLAGLTAPEKVAGDHR